MTTRGKTYDPGEQTRFDGLLKNIKPTVATGTTLKKRIEEMQCLINDKCGEFGQILAAKWPRDKREAHMVIPVMMTEQGGVEAVIDISVGLYDDFGFIKKSNHDICTTKQ